MSKFRYRARDKNGTEQGGIHDAGDRYELARILRQDGLLLLEAEDVETKKRAFSLNFNISPELAARFGRVRLSEKIIFSKNLGVMIGAGLSLTRALDALMRESHNQKFKGIINDVTDQIRQGKTFAESLGRHPKVFPQLYISMVEAGEKSGKLKESLSVIAGQMQADYDLIRKVRGAMMYPAVILVAMTLIGILMMIYVVPTLTSVFAELDAELPATTQFVISFSNALVNHGLLMALGAFLAIAGLVYFRKTPLGKRTMDTVMIKMPLVSTLAKKFNAARTARTLSSLLSSGVQVMEALDITSRVVQNHFYSVILVDAKKSIQKGETISKIFLEHEDLYPSLVGEMLSVGEETGESSRMLSEVALFYEQQVADTTRDLSTIIEPILMIFIGVVVGFFAIAMLTPMYSLTEKIQ